MADITKECSICGKALGTITCRVCGRVVCRNCVNRKLGVCSACAKGKRV